MIAETCILVGLLVASPSETTITYTEVDGYDYLHQELFKVLVSDPKIGPLDLKTLTLPGIRCRDQSRSSIRLAYYQVPR